jgi:hypothetical protein
VVVVRVVVSSLAMPGEIIAAQGFVTRKLMERTRCARFLTRKWKATLTR